MFSGNGFDNIAIPRSPDSPMQHLDPPAAHAFLLQHPEAVLVDCRSAVEHLYVGHPVGAEHVAWQEAPDWEIDPEFADLVRRLVRGDLRRPVLLICRSGHRSLHAGMALEEAGFSTVINVLEGFEGPRNAAYHRGKLGGWRFHGLPWQQT
jgi:rhodanese-related sulfurtransferase